MQASTPMSAGALGAVAVLVEASKDADDDEDDDGGGGSVAGGRRWTASRHTPQWQPVVDGGSVIAEELPAGCESASPAAAAAADPRLPRVAAPVAALSADPAAAVSSRVKQDAVAFAPESRIGPGAAAAASPGAETCDLADEAATVRRVPWLTPVAAEAEVASAAAMAEADADADIPAKTPTRTFRRRRRR